MIKIKSKTKNSERNWLNVNNPLKIQPNVLRKKPQIIANQLLQTNSKNQLKISKKLSKEKAKNYEKNYKKNCINKK